MRRALQTAVAAVATYAVARAAGLPEASWAVISALFVVQRSLGGTLTAAFGRVFGTIGGTAVGLAALYLIGDGIWRTAVSLVLATVVIDLTAGFRPSLRYGLVPAGILLVGPVPEGAEVMTVAWERALAIGLGAAIASAVAALVFPERAHLDADRHLGMAVRRCGDLVGAGIALLNDEAERDLQPIHDDIRRHLQTAETLIETSHRPRFHDRHGPRLERLLAMAERLWHSLIILHRTDEKGPLPEPARSALAPALDALATEARTYLETLGHSLARGMAPPSPETVRRRLGDLDQALGSLRRRGGARTLPQTAMERIFTVAFALQQVAGDLNGMADLAGNGQSRPSGQSVAPRL